MKNNKRYYIAMNWFGIILVSHIVQYPESDDTKLYIHGRGIWWGYSTGVNLQEARTKMYEKLLDILLGKVDANYYRTRLGK